MCANEDMKERELNPLKMRAAYDCAHKPSQLSCESEEKCSWIPGKIDNPESINTLACGDLGLPCCPNCPCLKRGLWCVYGICQECLYDFNCKENKVCVIATNPAFTEDPEKGEEKKKEKEKKKEEEKKKDGEKKKEGETKEEEPTAPNQKFKIPEYIFQCSMEPVGATSEGSYVDARSDLEIELTRTRNCIELRDDATNWALASFLRRFDRLKKGSEIQIQAKGNRKGMAAQIKSLGGFKGVLAFFLMPFFVRGLVMFGCLFDLVFGFSDTNSLDFLYNTPIFSLFEYLMQALYQLKLTCAGAVDSEIARTLKGIIMIVDIIGELISNSIGGLLELLFDFLLEIAQKILRLPIDWLNPIMEKAIKTLNKKYD